MTIVNEVAPGEISGAETNLWEALVGSRAGEVGIQIDGVWRISTVREIRELAQMLLDAALEAEAEALFPQKAEVPDAAE